MDSYCMWRYEHEFQSSVEINARSIFTTLDVNLSPRVFLVGFLNEIRLEREPVCVKPLSSGYHPSVFGGVRAAAQHTNVDESQITEGRLLSQTSLDHRIESFALRIVLEETLNNVDEGVLSFCSLPVLVEDYLVSTVIQFDREFYQAHYELTQGQVQGFDVSTSLVDAIVTTFLEECSEALSKPRPVSLRRERAEIVRSAGKLLMRTPAFKADPFLGSQELFDACRNIASLRYEGGESAGMMLIARRDHPAIETVVYLENSIPIDSYRAVRKMLEISSTNLCLLCDSSRIYGFGRMSDQYDVGGEDLFVVRFTRHHVWELMHAGEVLMQVSYGQPGMVKHQIDVELFKSYARHLFPDISEDRIGNLWDLVQTAARQEHGTIVVISDEAQSEAARLETQSIRIKPILLTTPVMEEITAIDGAVLIDPKSRCYAFGVILDGLASTRGDPSRGSRYNSAVKYAESTDHACLVVVVSEDGYIDLIPEVVSPMRRSDILDAVARLRETYNTDEINLKDYYTTLEWLQEHQQYLWPEITEEINQLMRLIRRRTSAETGQGTRSSSEFEPNFDVDNSYFVD